MELTHSSELYSAVTDNLNVSYKFLEDDRQFLLRLMRLHDQECDLAADEGR
jgi:hypothetical protein